jgi:hypothetical protein
MTLGCIPRTVRVGARSDAEVTKSNSRMFCGAVGTKGTPGEYTGDDEIGLNSGAGTIQVK